MCMTCSFEGEKLVDVMVIEREEDCGRLSFW